MNKVIAIIPIKTNNQRLPGKNTKMLGENPLYHYMFTTTKNVNNIDQVWVDSSDSEILEIGLKYGFNTIDSVDMYTAVRENIQPQIEEWED